MRLLEVLATNHVPTWLLISAHGWRMYFPEAMLVKCSVGFLVLLLLALAVMTFCWWQGKLDKYLPVRIRSTTVLGTNAPAYQPPAATLGQTATTPANPPK